MAEPQGNEGFLTEMDIRIWMRDTDPKLNYLLDDYEFDSEELRTAMTLTVDKWNETPPFLGATGNYTLITFPFRGMLLRGTVANLLFMAAHRFRRNSLKYNVPGGTVADQEKFQEYDGAGEKLWQEYTTWLQHAKRAINMEAGFAISYGPTPSCGY